MQQPYHECPRFEKCSAPKCPLDPDYHSRSPRLADEERCGVDKVIRLRIAMKYKDLCKLPYDGYKPREYIGLKNAGKLKSCSSPCVGFDLLSTEGKGMPS